MLNRRHFIVSTAALAAASPADAKGLDPADKDIRFGTTGSIFGVWPNAGAQNTISMKMSTDMPHDAQGRKALRPGGLRALCAHRWCSISTIPWH